MGSVSVLIDDDVFDRLQRLATPLVDDVNSVIRRLLAGSANTANTGNTLAPRFLRLPRGEWLRVGLQLRTEFHGEVFEAEVTAAGILFDGDLYESPSAAARAVKRKCGLPEPGAHTNGWLFWDYLGDLGYVRLNELRVAQAKHEPAAGAGHVATPRSLASAESGFRDTGRLAGDIRPEPPAWRSS